MARAHPVCGPYQDARAVTDTPRTSAAKQATPGSAQRASGVGTLAPHIFDRGTCQLGHSLNRGMDRPGRCPAIPGVAFWDQRVSCRWIDRRWTSFRDGGLRIPQAGTMGRLTHTVWLEKNIVVAGRFVFIGLLSTLFPQLPRNGKGPRNWGLTEISASGSPLACWP